jgi:TonB-dependent receptor
LLQQGFAQSGTIKGNAYDLISHDGLSGAYISLDQTSFHQAADAKGNFELRNIPAGEYELIVTTVGYTEVRRHISLKAGEVQKVFIGLNPGGKSLEEVTVFGRADREKETGSRDREKSAANMMNVISSQAMVRSPDVNAANVLQRMSGVTIQRSNGGDEAYAIVRGMEPRYNNTLLNGEKIASPDNKSRYVQLGIIPSDILSSIEISKSLLPDMEGDATGGTINMVVKDAPDKTSFKATGSIGYSQLYFNEHYIYFPTSGIQSQSPIQRNPLGYVAQPGDFSRSNLDFKSEQAPPTALAGFSFTHRWFKDKLGFVLADNIQNQYYGNISSQAGTTPGNDTTGKLQRTDANNFQQYTQQLNNGLVVHLDYVINEKNKVNIDEFYLYSYLAQSRFNVDTTLIGTGRVGPGTGQIHLDAISQTQHTYVNNVRVSGQHYLLPALKLDWAGIESQAGNRQPDVADISTDFLINQNFTQTATFFDGIHRTWQNNNDKEYSGRLNLDYKIKAGSGNDLELKAGGLYRYSSRYNTQDEYSLVSPSTNSGGGAATKEVWTNINDIQWQVFNTAGTSYNPNDFKATETIYAGYLMARYTNAKWELAGGLRMEYTNDVWQTRVHSVTEPDSGYQAYTEFLPSAALKYKLSARENLHFSYFRSISRPNYYELVYGASPVSPNGEIADGNPYVMHAVAENFDIRYEIFPKGEEHLFIGAFYKRINNPIELRLVGNGHGALYVTPLNSNPANNLGAEISFTQYWGRFGVTGNYAYTHSAISSQQLNFKGDTVYPTRPMQGQAEHVGNLSLLYKDTKHGTFAQLAYEYQGLTLAQTGSYAGADFYQRPTNTLAFSCEKDIHKHFTVFAKANNLLNTPIKEYVQNTVLVLQNTYWATFNVGVRYAY